MQGLEGAKAYQVNTSNAEVYLRDSDDSDILYIKTTDQYGRPNTLRMFRLTAERSGQCCTDGNYPVCNQ